MSLGRVAGGLAVLLVIGTVVGTLGALATVNSLLLGSANQVAALATLALVAAVLAGLVVLGGPSREWVGNPYW